MTETMIERVARAIDPALWTRSDPATVEGKRDLTYWRRHSVKKSRAAIEAMREPMHTMLDSGDLTLPQFAEGHVRMEHLRVAWQAMIDAALNEKAEP